MDDHEMNALVKKFLLAKLQSDLEIEEAVKKRIDDYNTDSRFRWGEAWTVAYRESGARLAAIKRQIGELKTELGID